MEQISNAHVAYTPMMIAVEDQMPLTPCRGGPVERPLLRGRGRNRLCYNCQEQGHIMKKCPLKKVTKKYCRHCNSHLHFPNECVFKWFNMLGEATCNATAGVIVRLAQVSFKREVVSGLQFGDE